MQELRLEVSGQRHCSELVLGGLETRIVGHPRTGRWSLAVKGRRMLCKRVSVTCGWWRSVDCLPYHSFSGSGEDVNKGEVM